MTERKLLARRAIEALRGGIATPSVVQSLGISQPAIESRVESDLEACAAEEEVTPLVVVGGFGSGKTHILNYIAATASSKGFVTSYVVVSPETPLGNLHVVLKALAEASRAPGHTGKALRELMAKYGSKSAGFARVRRWAAERDDIHDRFSAMLHLYEVSSDPEFQSKVLADLEGHPMLKTAIKSALREIGQLQAYDLSHPKNRHLAPERLLLLSQLYRACDCKGWVVMFDELERLAFFPRKQRVEAYRAIGWWTQQARQGLGVYPVFAFAPGSIDEVWRKYEDHRFLDSTIQGSLFGEPVDLARLGLDILAKYRVLIEQPDAEQRERTLYAVRELYATAYDWRPQNPAVTFRNMAPGSIRSQIRRWIAELDLNRVYGSSGEIVDEGLIMDTRELSEEEIATDEESENATEI